MLNAETISTIIGVFTGFGVMVAGCGFAYSSWRNGNNKYKDELISDQKSRLENKDLQIVELNKEITTLVKSHQGQITDLQKELSELKGAFAEQSKKLEEYRSILENRDPQTIKILTEIKRGVDLVNKNNQDSKEALIAAANKLEKNK